MFVSMGADQGNTTDDRNRFGVNDKFCIEYCDKSETNQIRTDDAEKYNQQTMSRNEMQINEDQFVEDIFKLS